MESDRLRESVELLEARVSRVAAEVERAMSEPLELSSEVLSSRRWITTGAGASEGPARALTALLREGGVAADFAPISSFALGAPPADACIVVSQRLSPNARVPLARVASYASTVLVTTIEPAEAPRGVHVVSHGPREEDGLLLRVIGPAAAHATMIRLAHAITTHGKRNGAAEPIAPVMEALATARSRVSEIDAASLFDVAGIVAIGSDVALAEGLRHKLLEGLGSAHPPVWDLCGLVHGPLQSFYERDATLVLLERDALEATELTQRLMRVLRPERHRVIRLRSSLPSAHALLDFDLQLDWLLLEALRARPRDLVEWPGKGRDGALYELGRI